MNGIVLVIDRLHVGHVGAYGNTWIETPSLDWLAAQSMVFDQCLITNPRLESLCCAYWQGGHPLAGPGLGADRPSLPSLLAAADVATALLTDEPAVATHPLSAAFDSAVSLDFPENRGLADRLEETHLAECFARIVDWLESARQPFLLWCHLTGLGGPWDAPPEFRQRYVEEDDPPPPDSDEVPCRMLEEDYDPDQLLGISQAYAGQVSLLDVCVGALLEFLDAGPIGANTLLGLISARGFPLGEHRRVGDYDESLYGELVHVPMGIRFPDGLGQAVRSQGLAHPGDVYPTLLDWWGLEHATPPGAASLMPLAREETESLRDRLCVVNASERGIRTPAWYLRDADRAELFAKPDDRWEVNDVANRCRDVVDMLREAFSEYQRFLRSGQLHALPPLDEALLTGLD